MDEGEIHVHTEACYAEEQVLTCDYSKVHEHTAACFDKDGRCICGYVEIQGHQHTEACFREEEIILEPGHTHSSRCYIRSLVCGKVEHVHSAKCHVVSDVDSEPAEGTTVSEDPQETSAQGEERETAEADDGFIEMLEDETEAAGNSDVGSPSEASADADSNVEKAAENHDAQTEESSNLFGEEELRENAGLDEDPDGEPQEADSREETERDAARYELAEIADTAEIDHLTEALREDGSADAVSAEDGQHDTAENPSVPVSTGDELLQGLPEGDDQALPGQDRPDGTELQDAETLEERENETETAELAEIDKESEIDEINEKLQDDGAALSEQAEEKLSEANEIPNAMEESEIFTTPSDLPEELSVLAATGDRYTVTVEGLSSVLLEGATLQVLEETVPSGEAEEDPVSSRRMFHLSVQAVDGTVLLPEMAVRVTFAFEEEFAGTVRAFRVDGTELEVEERETGLSFEMALPGTVIIAWGDTAEDADFLHMEDVPTAENFEETVGTAISTPSDLGVANDEENLDADVQTRIMEAAGEGFTVTVEGDLAELPEDAVLQAEVLPSEDVEDNEQAFMLSIVTEDGEVELSGRTMHVTFFFDEAVQPSVRVILDDETEPEAETLENSVSCETDRLGKISFVWEAEEAENHHKPVFDLDVSEWDTPYSVRAMMDAVTASTGTDEDGEETGMEDLLDVESWIIHANPEEAHVSFEDEDWLVMPVASFETMEIVVETGREEYTLFLQGGIVRIERLDLGMATIRAIGEELPDQASGSASLVVDESEKADALKAIESFLAMPKETVTALSAKGRRNTARPAEENAVRTDEKYQVFDISLDNVDQSAFQDGFRVDVVLPTALVGREFELYHIHDDVVTDITATLEIDGDEIQDGNRRLKGFSFMTDGFSQFVLKYTVDFSYSVNGQTYHFSLPGGGKITLSDLVEVLGIIRDANSEDNAAFDRVEDFLKEVADVEFSNPALISVVRVDTDTTVGQIKDDLSLEVEYSADLTEADIDEINNSRVHAGDWLLLGLRPFVSEETLTITMKNGDEIQVHVADAQHVEELALMLESAVVYENNTEIPWPAIVRDNKFYDIRLTFKENSTYQFLDTADEMYYPVPEGMDLGDEDFTHDFSMDVGDGVKLEGNTVKYDAATKRFIIKWNTEDKVAFNKLIASNSAEFRLDFKAKFDFTKDTIEFSENVIGKVIKDTSYDVDVEKTGVYNEDEDRIDYTVTVTSYGESKEVKVTDKLFGTALTYISEGENSGVSWRAYDADGNPKTNDTIGSVQVLKTKKDTYPDRDSDQDCGFEVEVGQMADGEKIEFTYSAAVDYDKLTGSGTYNETFNKVVVKTPTGEKEKDHSFTGSLHYVKLQKDHDKPINWNGDNATVKWFITVNEECKVGMKGTVVSDRIYAGDVEAMDYSGSGLHVAVFDDKGAFVGEYDVPWEDSSITKNGLGINTETEEIDYASWHYTIPEKQDAVGANGAPTVIENANHYKYVFSYTTDADKSLMVFDGYIGNEASESKTDNEMQDGFYPPGTGTVPEVHKAVEPQTDPALKAPNGSNEEYIYWVITFDRQRYDLTRCVIEDNNPTLWGNAEPVDVTKTKSGYEYLYVEGLTANEGWEVSSATDTRTTIKFYQDSDKTKPGLLKASELYTGENGGASNTITIHLRTRNSAIWMDGTLTKYWPRNHTNTVTWIPNAHQVEAEATATPDVRKIIKEGIQVGTIIKDGVSLPVFRYELFLVGIDENSFPDGKLVLDDAFDITKLALISPDDLTEAKGFEYTQELQENIGNYRIQSYWDQKLKGYGVVNGWIGPVPVTDTETETGIQFTISQSNFNDKV
ncbi:MAG: hypothetical protein IJ083_01755 [Clostridia bacterium]|nr:hypothetical protein [Clostridia bacterium]